MNVVTLGNCQCSDIRDILKKLPNISVKSAMDLGPTYHDAMSQCDLFIYQPAWSKPYDVSMLPTTCAKASFPYIYNNGVFIMYGWRSTVYNKEAVLSLGVSQDRAIKMLENMEIDFHCPERFERSVRLLEEHEVDCNIKVSPFVKDNYKETRLFNTQNHPSGSLIYHVLNRALEMVGIGPLEAKEIDNGCWQATPYEVNSLGLPYEPHGDWKKTYANLIREIYAEVHA